MNHDELVAALTRAHNENRILDLEKQIQQLKIDQLERDLGLLMEPGESRIAPQIGTFHTREIRPWSEPAQEMSRTIPFAVPYSAPPGLPVGLTAVHMGNGDAVRITSYATKIETASFTINIKTWDETVLNGAGCTWLQIPADDPDFQFGHWSTEDHHHWNKPQLLTTHLVIFPHQYASPPHVVVWLRSFSMVAQETYRVRTYATDITISGFTLHIDSRGDSTLATAEATWVTYPAGKCNVFSGSFATKAVKPQLLNAGFKMFPPGHFKVPPRVLSAINMLEISRAGKMRFVVTTPHIGVEGMAWEINGEGDTVLCSAGASFIALG